MNGGSVSLPRRDLTETALWSLRTFFLAETCGAGRDRTDDLRLAKPALSQLSYSPDRLVGQGRLELPTSRLSGVRSNHLSYWPDRDPLI